MFPKTLEPEERSSCTHLGDEGMRFIIKVHIRDTYSPDESAEPAAMLEQNYQDTAVVSREADKMRASIGDANAHIREANTY